MGKLLLTGAAGFTGRHLAAYLGGQGWNVTGMGSHPSDDGSVSCDLTDGESVDKIVSEVQPEFVVHLAAVSFVGRADSAAFYAVNLFGTLNLLQSLARMPRKPKLVIVASSANVYGSNARAVTDESICPAPVNHYGCSKLAMEHMVRTWFETLPLVITRPFNYSGVGQDSQFLIPKIVDHFKLGKRRIKLGNTHVRRDFSDVRDVARAYEAILNSDMQSETVNICSGVSYSIDQILGDLQSIAGYDIDVQVDPDLVRANEIDELRGSNEKLFDRTGFQPSISLPETLRWMMSSTD